MSAPIIEDWVSDNEKDDVPQAKIEKKTFKPSFDKIEFVKPKQQEKTARKTINGEVQLQALVDGKKIIITEGSIRRDLQLNDEEGMDCLPNATIFEELTKTSAKTTAWNEISSTMASAIICLATNQKSNFSKYIFESMVKNLENVSGEGLANPTNPHHTPTITQPSTSQSQKKEKPRKPKRKDTEVPQLSGPTDNVTDEAVYEEMDDCLERAATTATSLDAEQDRGNINKTQSKTTLNEPSSLGTSSDSGPRRQKTMGDTIAQTGFENVSKLSNDPLLARGNTLQSGKDSLKLKELMELFSTHFDANIDMFGVHDLVGDEVVVENEVASKDVNLSVDEVTLAQALAALKTEEQEKLSIEEKSKLFVQLLEARKKHFAAIKAKEKRNKPPTKAQKRNTMSTYLKNMVGYKHNQLKNKSFDDIQKLFDKAIKKVNTFVDMDTELVESSKVRAEAERVQEISSKRAGTELEQESIKKEKVNEDKETTELQKLIEVVLDKEEVAIDAIPLATKPPSIVDNKIHKEGKKTYYKIIKADGTKHGSTRPEEGYERVLWGNLKTMFDPHVEDQVWRNQQDYRVLNWKIYDSCGVHSLRKQNVHIYMLVEKRYPLTLATITDMLNRKLQPDHYNEMYYQLLKLITKQLKNQ
ncbi:hypothetical protein Tco_1228511 [Tanacetum coccineum]